LYYLVIIRAMERREQDIPEAAKDMPRGTELL
jgi:hypothetical protein